MNRSELFEQFRNLQTPFYYYDMELLQQTIDELNLHIDPTWMKIHYALKANVNKPILEMIRSNGFGADCVSGNEILLAIENGFSPQNIVFAGVGKTDIDIQLALNYDIACFNCESLQEVQVIDQIAASMGKIARIAIRLNPNVDAQTHEHITTGIEQNKFGLSHEEFLKLLELRDEMRFIRITGLHFHIGSQITDFTVFERLCRRVNNIKSWVETYHFPLEHINLGGGLGIDYDNPDRNPIPDFRRYIKTLRDSLEMSEDQQLHLEPGRSLVGQCGSLISRVLYIKNGGTKRFAVLDAGFTELLRPALYQSTHKIENLSSDKNALTYDIVGPICESTDRFGTGILLPETERGDLMLIRSAGAYGEVMSSYYNMRNKARSYYSSSIGSSTMIEECASQIGDILNEINQHL
ncbi:MAG: diaminopimelate decarboxylase [Bacteroidetes bacterium]|nr:diaminopimelate decarboxylase [Bacteroidota bacterium]